MAEDGEPGVLSPETLYRRVRAYLGRTPHGADEDLVQEMVLVCLERQGDPTNLRWVYARALDRVHPRHHTAAGRVRPTLTKAQSWSLDGPDSHRYTAREQTGFEGQHLRAPAWPEEALVAHLPPRGELRAKLLLRLAYGYSEAEIGRLWGVAESRIAQQLGGGKAAVLLGQIPEGPLPIGALTWEVAWIRL